MSDHSQAVDLAYRCLVFLVGDEATREEAEAALDHAPKLAVGMSFAVRNGALDMFEPQREPVPYVDYLPVAVSEGRAQEILDALNSFVTNGISRTHSEGWALMQPEVAHVHNFWSTDPSPEVELTDGTVMAFSRDVRRWEFAAVAR